MNNIMTENLDSDNIAVEDFSQRNDFLTNFCEGKILVAGIDIASKQSQLCIMTCNEEGKAVIDNRLYRNDELKKELSSYAQSGKKLVIGMESCGSSSYWANFCIKLGHEAEIIDARKIKAIKPKRAGKSDARDAYAIASFVYQDYFMEHMMHQPVMIRPMKNIVTQKLCNLHSMLTKINQQVSECLQSGTREMQGCSKSTGKDLFEIFTEFKTVLHNTVEEAKKENLTDRPTEGITSIDNEQLDQIEKTLTKDIETVAAAISKSLADIESVMKSACEKAPEGSPLYCLKSMQYIGPVTAYILDSTVYIWTRFKNARSLCAFIGTCPGITGTGGKKAITDTYFSGIPEVKRRLVQCGHNYARKNTPKGKSRRSVASSYANKLVRIAFSLVKSHKPYNDGEYLEKALYIKHIYAAKKFARHGVGI